MSDSERRDDRQDQQDEREGEWWEALLIDALGVALAYVDVNQFSFDEEPLSEAVAVYEAASNKRVVFLAERLAHRKETFDPA